MKKYFDTLKKQKYNVSYINFYDVNDLFYKSLENVRYMNPIDHKLYNKYSKLLKNAIILDNLNYTLTPSEIIENKKEFYRNNKYSHDLFYKFQRRRLDILMKKDDSPEGGKWSYDTDNRKALPSNKTVPELPKIKKDKYYKEAKDYINKHFEKNYGDVDEWLYPIDTKTAILWLDNFLDERLKNFGPYQDAVDTTKPFVYHSIISPMMNIGILPDYLVVSKSNEYYKKHKSKIPI